MSGLLLTHDNSDLAYGSDKRHDFHSAIFSLNWLSFGFALAYCADSEYIYSRMKAMNVMEEGFYAAFLPLGGFIGTLLTGILLKPIFGYKMCQVLSCFISAIGWYIHSMVVIIIEVHPDKALKFLLLGRIFVGIACGISVYVVPISCALSASTRLRHLFGIFPPLAFNFGFFLCYLYGWFLIKYDVTILGPIGSDSTIHDWINLRGVSYYPLLGIVFSIIGLFFSVVFDEGYVTEDWTLYISDVQFDPFIGQITTYYDRLREKWVFFTQRYILKELSISLIMAIQQMVGINVVTFNATTLFLSYFKDAEKDPSSPALIGICIGVIYLVSTVIICYLAEKMKRTHLLYAGSIIMSICHFSLGICFYFNYSSYLITPIICLIFVGVFCCTWGPFPWLIVSEIFDPRIRNLGMTLSCVWMWVSMFMLTVGYAPLIQYIKASGLFFMLCGFSIASIIFTNLFIPETKYLPFDKIQDFFKQS